MIHKADQIKDVAVAAGLGLSGFGGFIINHLDELVSAGWMIGSFLSVWIGVIIGFRTLYRSGVRKHPPNNGDDK